MIATSCEVLYPSQDKGNVMDVKNKKFVRSIPQWGGRTSKDGR